MKKQDALRISFQAMSEIAIIGHLADTALAKVLPRVCGTSPRMASGGRMCISSNRLPATTPMPAFSWKRLCGVWSL